MFDYGVVIVVVGDGDGRVEVIIGGDTLSPIEELSFLVLPRTA